MNLNEIKTNKKHLAVLGIVIVLVAILGFYSGRYYERKTFQNRFVQMRGNFQGRQNGTGQRLYGQDQNGMMRNFQQ